MQLNKESILKSIKSFLGADNELALKEAEHQIKIFEVIFEKEIEDFKKSEPKEIEDPEKDSNNIEIINAIKLFKEDQKRKKEKRKKEEKTNTEAKRQILKAFENLINSKEKLSDLATGIKEIKNRWNKIQNVSIQMTIVYKKSLVN